MKALASEITTLGQFGAGAARTLLVNTEELADKCRIDLVADSGWEFL